ncbi:MAG TPA: tetratricopeptide repeat protein [Armatimonadota bacterium]
MCANIPSNRESGLQFLQQGKYAESIPYLVMAVGEQSTDIDLAIYLAYAYSQIGDMDNALEVLERAADIFPTSAKIHYNLGVAYQRAHNSTQAKDEYLRALGLDAKYVPAKTALDNLYHVDANASSVSIPPTV